MAESSAAVAGAGVDARVDPLTGALVHVVGARQGRPNQPDASCPFCPGGVEAPDPYEVRWFVNRWPAMPQERCEVVLYTPEHDATFHSIGAAGAGRVVDLWAERTAALAERDDVAYVLAFENRGVDVGATIAHPHGQIYAFEDVPPVPAAEAEMADAEHADPLAAPFDPDLVVSEAGTGGRSCPTAPAHPVEVVLAPIRHVPDLAVARRRRARRPGRPARRRRRPLRPAVRRAAPVHALDPPAPDPPSTTGRVRLHLHLVSPMRARHAAALRRRRRARLRRLLQPREPPRRRRPAARRWA